MLQKTLLAIGCVLLLCGGAVFVAMAGGDMTPPVLAAVRAADRHAAAILEADGTTTPAAPNASAPTEPAERMTAGEQAATVRPIPEDAEWITVTVVDEETLKPIPGASVRWFDESAWTFLEEQRPLTEDERTWLRRDVDHFADLAGWRTTTDSEGQARVNVAGATTVLAALGDRFGTTQLQTNTLAPPGGHRIELGIDRCVRVRVLDAMGAVCVDVSVALDIADTSGDVVGTCAIARTEAPHGVATLRHLQSIAVATRSRENATAGLRARAALPGHQVHSATFSPADLPTEPIVLRLPACGSVRVRAEVAGKPLPAVGIVLLQTDGDDRDLCRCSRRVDEDGWARFPHVPLGRRFTAWSDAYGGVWREFAGPVAADQQVAVAIVPGDDAVVLRGRMLERQHAPLGGCNLTIQVTGPRWDATVRARSDAGGRFEVSIGSPPEDAHVECLWIDCARKGEPTLRAIVAPRTLRSGVEDLGDLLAADLPLIVGGRFMSDDPAALRDLIVEIERCGANGERDEANVPVLSHVDASGAFVVRGDVEPGRYRLVVTAPHVLPIAPIEFLRGRTDLVIPVDRGNRLAASVLLPRDSDADLLVAELAPAVPFTKPELMRERLCATPACDGEERHHLRWQTVPPGAYTLELRTWLSTPVLRIRDVQVPGPANGDSRLLDMDLRALVRAARLRLCNAAGGPIEHHLRGAVFPAGATRAPASRAIGVWWTNTRLLLPAGPADLLVCVEGFQPQPCRSLGDELELRLEPWRPLHVEFEAMPVLPEGVEAYARLVPATPGDNDDDARTVYETQRGQCSSCLFAAPRPWVAIDGGKAEFALSEANHGFEVYVGSSGGNSRIRVAPPATPLATQSHVTVRVPAADWQRALDALAPPK